MEGRRFFGRRPIGLSDGRGIDKAEKTEAFDESQRGTRNALPPSGKRGK